MKTITTVQTELEAELAKKKARAARFQMPVKTTAEEVCFAMVCPACVQHHAALDTISSLNPPICTGTLLSLVMLGRYDCSWRW